MTDNIDDTTEEQEREVIFSVLDSLQRIFGELAEEHGFETSSKYGDHDERSQVEFTPTKGIYERAQLETADGTVYQLRDVHYWSERLDGCRLVDVDENQFPNDLELAECRLIVYTNAGVPLLGGPLADGGESTVGSHRSLLVENERNT